MTARPRTTASALIGLIGPIIWAAHFFSVYLAESLLCSSTEADKLVRLAGVILTIVAAAGLLWARRRSVDSEWAWLIRPLIDISIIAVIWTSIPLFTLQACMQAGV